MRKLKIYLDTSVWNFFFADDAPEKKEITLSFFNEISQYDIYTSAIVIEEISRASTEKKKLLLDLVKKFSPILLNPDVEIERLAGLYQSRGIIPLKETDDALHIGYSTFYELDILLSWNYKHLANLQKKQKIAIVNLEEGYHKPLEIITPYEVIGNE